MKIILTFLMCIFLFSGCARVDNSADITLPTVESTTPAETTEPTASSTTEAPTGPSSEPVNEPAETELPKLTIKHPFILEGNPLTREELDWFQNEFFTYTNTDALGNLTFNIRNMFLRAEFEKPEEIDFGIVFRDGVTRFSEVSQEEKDLYDKVTDNDWPLTYVKTRREDMERLFYENTGISIAQTQKIGLDKLVYLEEYDAYYIKKGDTGYTYWTMEEGAWMEDGTVVILYTPKYERPVYVSKVTLVPYGDSYVFASNERGDSP